MKRRKGGRKAVRLSPVPLHLYVVLTRTLAMDSYRLADADAVLPGVKAGDPAAQEALYRAFEAPVYSLARRICRTTEDAEDVLQETFLEVYRSIGRYRGEGSLWGWIRTIASSKALMRLRRNKYRETDELQDDVTPLRREDTALRMDLEAALERPHTRLRRWLGEEVPA